MRDLTSMCLKKSYKRGPPRQPSCEDPETEMDPIHNLCFQKCADGYVSGGTMCWRQCTEGTSPCGGVLCLDDREKDKCTDQVIAYVAKAIDEIKAEAAECEDALLNAGMVLPDLKLPVCP